jgi:methionyl aminopeptidase
VIIIKNKAAIIKMETAARKLAEILKEVAPLVKEGVTTLELDEFVVKQLAEKGLVSRCKGYMGYQHVTCISINDEVVHGVPKKEKVIKSGDLVKIDICASWKTYCADMARCFFVGKVSDKIKKLVAVAQQSLDKGIEQAVVGNRVSDISSAVQKEVEKYGFGVVRDFAGHGIGKSLHEDPEVLNYGKPGRGPLLRVGMTIAIEPMITYGQYDVYIAQDGWTVKTEDKSWAAHVEDTVLITESGPKILTRL